MGIRDSHFFHEILRVVLERKFERKYYLKMGRKWDLAIVPIFPTLEWSNTNGQLVLYLSL